MIENLVLTPWEHCVTENCLESKSFELLKDSLENTFKNVDEGNHVFDLHDLHKMGVNDHILEIIIEHTDNVIKSDLFKNFSVYQKSKYGYFCLPKIGVSKNKRYGIHDDTSGNYKCLSYLVYISPSHSTGTILYDGDAQHSTIEWKQNNGVYFCPIENLTYHDFLSNDEIRITLNINISALEMLYDTNHLNDMIALDKDKVLYAYDIFKQNRLFVTETNFLEFIEKHL